MTDVLDASFTSSKIASIIICVPFDYAARAHYTIGESPCRNVPGGVIDGEKQWAGVKSSVPRIIHCCLHAFPILNAWRCRLAEVSPASTE